MNVFLNIFTHSGLHWQDFGLKTKKNPKLTLELDTYILTLFKGFALLLVDIWSGNHLERAGCGIS